MELLTPSIGLLFWTFVSFVILLFILGKFAWKPILNAVKTRDESIETALLQAEKARAEMAALVADNQKLLQEAKEERAKLLKEAKEIGERLIAEAKEKAGVEYSKKVADAVQEIQNQKVAALTELKNQAGSLAVNIAEKLLKKELAHKQDQENFAAGLVDDFKLN